MGQSCQNTIIVNDADNLHSDVWRDLVDGVKPMRTGVILRDGTLIISVAPDARSYTFEVGTLYGASFTYEVSKAALSEKFRVAVEKGAAADTRQPAADTRQPADE